MFHATLVAITLLIGGGFALRGVWLVLSFAVAGQYVDVMERAVFAQELKRALAANQAGGT